MSTKYKIKSFIYPSYFKMGVTLVYLGLSTPKREIKKNTPYKYLSYFSEKKKLLYPRIGADQAVKLYLLILWDEWWFSLPSKLFIPKRNGSFEKSNFPPKEKSIILSEKSIFQAPRKNF